MTNDEMAEYQKRQRFSTMNILDHFKIVESFLIGKVMIRKYCKKIESVRLIVTQNNVIYHSNVSTSPLPKQDVIIYKLQYPDYFNNKYNCLISNIQIRMFSYGEIRFYDLGWKCLNTENISNLVKLIKEQSNESS